MSLTFPAIANEHAWIVLSFYRNIFFTRDKRKLFKYSPSFDAFEYLPVASYLRNELEIFCSLITIIHHTMVNNCFSKDLA